MIAKFGVFHSITVNSLKEEDGNKDMQEIAKSVSLVRIFPVNSIDDEPELEDKAVENALTSAREWFRNFRNSLSYNF